MSISVVYVFAALLLSLLEYPKIGTASVASISQVLSLFLGN